MKTFNLFNMELHQKVEVNSTTSVLRVSGGWIYLFSFKNEDGTITSTSSFVPKSNEFRKGDGNYVIV